jgi:multidrug efflux pump
VQVQNKVQQALSRLPSVVQQQGVRVTKSNPDFLLVAFVADTYDRTTNIDVSDFGEPVAGADRPHRRRGPNQRFGAQYAMRIWLDPNKLAANQLMPSDVITAITAQNAEVAAEIGAVPSPAGQMLDATVTAQSRLTSPAEFAQIVVKSATQRRNGSAFGCRPHRTGRGILWRGQPRERTSGRGSGGFAGAGRGRSGHGQAGEGQVCRSSKTFPAGYNMALPMTRRASSPNRA